MAGREDVDTLVATILDGRLTTGVMTGIGLRVVDTLIMYLLANAPSLLPQYVQLLLHDALHFTSQ